MAADTATTAARLAAADALQPIANDPGIREIIVAVSGTGEDPDSRIEKAISKIGAARLALVEDASVTPAQAFELGTRLEKAERSLQAEHLRRHSVGFAKAKANDAEAARLLARNTGRAA
jgi:hypothetical protein